MKNIRKMFKVIGMGAIISFLIFMNDTWGGAGNKESPSPANPLQQLVPFPYIPDIPSNPDQNTLSKNMFKKIPGHLPTLKDIPHHSPAGKVPVIVELKEFPFIKHVLSQGPSGKGMPQDVRELVGTKMGQDYVAKLKREHERVINQIWEMEKELAISRGEDPSIVDKPPIKVEYFYASNGFATTMSPELIYKVEKLGSVLNVSLDYIVQVHLYETVPFTGAKAVQDPPNNITGQGIRIAVADTGIMWDHKDFGIGGGYGCYGAGCRVVKGKNWAAAPSPDNLCAQGDKYKNGYDCMGHGSHVAGIAAASRRTIGTYNYGGIASDAQLISLRVVDEKGEGTKSLIGAAIDWAAVGCAVDYEQPKQVCPHILNLSLGDACESTDKKHCDDNDILIGAIENATNMGVLVVASAGNNGKKGEFFQIIQSPAIAPDALTVGATQKTNDLFAHYTANGPAPICDIDSGAGTSDCDPACAPNCSKVDCDKICDSTDTIRWDIKPDMLDPGGRGGLSNVYDNICSTKIPDSKVGLADCMDAEHVFLAGTSMAAPHAAGAAALLFQKYPKLTEDILQRARYAKGILLQSGFLDIKDPSLFETGGGRGKIDESTLDGVVIMPYNLNLGQASFADSGSSWSPPPQTIEIRNYTAETITLNLTSQDNIDYRDPGALTVMMPQAIVVPPTQKGDPGVKFDALFTLQRKAPNPPPPGIGFEGNIIASGTWGGKTRSIHVPFFIRPPKISPCATFIPTPDQIVIHDREDFVLMIPPADLQTLSLMEGTYDIAALWLPTETDPLPSLVVKEQQKIDSTTCFTISKSDAIYTITLNPLDRFDRSLFPEGGTFLSAYPVVGGVQKLKTAFYIPIPIPGAFATALRVSPISTTYNIDLLVIGMRDGELYGVSVRENGILGSKTITIGGSGVNYFNFSIKPERDQFPPTYAKDPPSPPPYEYYIQPAFGNSSIPNYSYPPSGSLAALVPVGFLLPDESLPTYVMPMGGDFYWREAQIRLMYRIPFCVRYCFLDCWELCWTFNIPTHWSPFYQFPSLSLGNAYAPGVSTPVMQIAPKSELPLGESPPQFFGRFQNEAQRVHLLPSLGSSRIFSHFQFLDVWTYYFYPQYYYTLKDGAGNLVRDGYLIDLTESSPSLEERIFLPSPGQYKFSTSYPGTIRVYGYGGSEKTEAGFNTFNPDPNPPSLRAFFVLKDAFMFFLGDYLYHPSFGKPTEVITTRSKNAVAFTVYDPLMMVNPMVLIQPRYDLPTDLTLSNRATQYGRLFWSVLPDLATTQPVRVILKSSDSMQNYISEDFDPGYIYVKSPFAYVGNLGSNDISVVDPLTGKVKWSMSTGAANSSVALARTGTKLLISHPGIGEVGIIDTATREHLYTVPVSGRNPEGIAVTPDDKIAFVAASNSTSISAIDLKGLWYFGYPAPQAIPIDIGGYSTDIAMSSDGTKAFVTNIKLNNTRALTVIDVATKSFADIVLPSTVGGVATFPMEVAPHPNGAKAYVSAWPNVVFVVNLGTNIVDKTITVGARPQGISVLPNGSKVYVANNDSSTVTVIRTDTDTVSASIDCYVGINPTGVDSTYDSKYVLVAGSSSNTLAVIDTIYDAPVKLISLSPGVYPMGVSVY